MSVRKLAIDQTAQTPLEFMLAVMANEDNPTLMRMDAAKNAAPYIHAKLQAVTIGGDPNNPLRHEHEIDLSAYAEDDLRTMLAIQRRVQLARNSELLGIEGKLN